MSRNDWKGGYYEAAIVLGRGEGEGADERLRAALRTVWSRGDVERGFPMDAVHVHDGAHLRGALDLSARSVPFGTHVVREENGDDWLSLGLPIGGLARLFPEAAGFPLQRDDDGRAWRKKVERRLASMVIDLARAVNVERAIIGYEVSGLSAHEAAGGGLAWLVRDGAELRYVPRTADR